MKKRYIALIIVIVLIIIAVASGIAYYMIIENGKNYEIEKIENYNYFVLKEKDLYGVIDRQGNILIEPEYNEIIIPNPEKAVFITYKEDEIKVLNNLNEQILGQYSNITPIRFKNISSDLMYEKSVLKYEKDGKYGLINLEGKVISEPIYDEIDSLQFKEGELLVKQNDKYGVINIKGNILIKLEYDEILTDEYYTSEDIYKKARLYCRNKNR